MSLKVKYFLFILLIHGVIALLVFQVLKEEQLYFLLAEIGIILSLVLSYLIYRSFIQPLDFIASGTNAIEDKDFNVKFVKTGALEMDRLVEVYNKMIDNLRNERIQTEEQHYFLEKLIQASPAGILILDYDDRLTVANPKAKELLNLKEGWLNQPLTLIKNEVLSAMVKIPIGQSEVISVKGHDRYKCEVSTFVHLGFQRKFILFQELSKEILAAEKKAYGKVIRMMAHEVNNSIGAINSILNSTVDYLEEIKFDEDIYHSLKVAIDRNDHLNRFMRNFAEVIRLPLPSRQKQNINQVFFDMAKLMEPQARERNIELVFDIAQTPVWLEMDVQQIEQVLVNALKNAMESIDQDGAIRLSSSADSPLLVIADNGPGIPKELASKIFSPFFSTKMNGQGLGLTLTREILMNHQADFSLKTIGEWTEFRVSFDEKPLA